MNYGIISYLLVLFQTFSFYIGSGHNVRSFFWSTYRPYGVIIENHYINGGGWMFSWRFDKNDRRLLGVMRNRKRIQDYCGG